MKTLIIICSFLLCIACENKSIKAKPDMAKHELRKFNVKNSISGHSSAWYFLVAGGYESGLTEKTTIRFYYKNCNGEFQFLDLPLTDVRIKIDTVEKPYAIFNMEYASVKCTSVKYDFEVNYVTIHCKEQDFQPEININDLR